MLLVKYCVLILLLYLLYKTIKMMTNYEYRMQMLDDEIAKINNTINSYSKLEKTIYETFMIVTLGICFVINCFIPIYYITYYYPIYSIGLWINIIFLLKTIRGYDVIYLSFIRNDFKVTREIFDDSCSKFSFYFWSGFYTIYYSLFIFVIIVTR